MVQGEVLGESESGEGEIEAESREHRAHGDQAPLGLPAFVFAVLRPAEETDQRRCVGERDLRPVDGQHAIPLLPQQPRRKLLFVSLAQVLPEDSPESKGQLPARLGEGRFARALVG